MTIEWQDDLRALRADMDNSSGLGRKYIIRPQVAGPVVFCDACGQVICSPTNNFKVMLDAVLAHNRDVH